MRKYIIIIFLLLGCLLGVQAQTPKKVIIHMKNGTTQRFNYSDVDCITFDSTISLNVTASVNSIDYSSANVVVHLEGDLSDVTEYGVIYGTESAQLNKTVSKSGTPSGENTFTLSGLDGVTQYYYRVYAKCGDQEFSSDLYNFTTTSKYEYVDLGLPSGTIWAAWNIGASSVTDYGTLYQWSDGDGDGTISTAAAPNNIQGTVYDTATQLWGSNWRIPNKEQMQELTEKCTWKGVDNYMNSGVNGFVVTGPNGNTIFIPSAGFVSPGETNITGKGNYAMYWTSEADDAKAAAYYQFAVSNHRNGSTSAKTKLPIRAIYVKGESTPTTPDIPVSSMGDAPEGTQAVDLGLSVKWSNFNLGATRNADAGDYYMWGDTKKQTNYVKQNYPHLNADGSLIDIGSEISNTGYDAAKAQWKGSWRMPTQADWSELINDCNWEWTTINNVEGFKVSSKKNKNFIFLPVTGQMSGENIVYGNEGHYWMSCPDPATANRLEWAYRMVLKQPSDSDAGHSTSRLYKWKGCIIRPVMDK